MSQIDSPWEAGATGVAELQPCLRNSRRKFINDPQGPPVSPARSRSPVLGLSHEVANCNFDIASTIFAGHRLCRSAPAAVEQNSDSLQTRRWRKFRLAHDRGEVADALVGVCPAQRSYVRWYFLTRQGFAGYVPLPVDAGIAPSGAATITRII